MTIKEAGRQRIYLLPRVTAVAPGAFAFGPNVSLTGFRAFAPSARVA